MDNNNLAEQNQQPDAQVPVLNQPDSQSPAVYVQQPIQPVVYQQQPQFAAVPSTPPVPGRGKGIALSVIGMVLGIASLVYFVLFFLMFLVYSEDLSWYFYRFSHSADNIFEFILENEEVLLVAEYFILSVLYAVTSLPFSIKGRRLIKSKMAGVGIVFSIITLVGSALLIMFLLLGFSIK